MVRFFSPTVERGREKRERERYGALLLTNCGARYDSEKCTRYHRIKSNDLYIYL